MLSTNQTKPYSWHARQPLPGLVTVVPDITFRGGNVGGEGKHVRPVGVGSHNASCHLDRSEDLSEKAADKITNESIASLYVGHISFDLPHRLQPVFQELRDYVKSSGSSFYAVKPCNSLSEQEALNFRAIFQNIFLVGYSQSF